MSKASLETVSAKHSPTKEWVITSDDYQPLLNKWQNTVDVMAEACNSPSGFIVQYRPEGFMAVVASEKTEKKYGTGDVIDPDVNLYCKKVVENKDSVYVPDATKDTYWDTNPEVADGLISYLGLPIRSPDGGIFGTICVLDVKATAYTPIYPRLLAQFRDIVEADLQLIERNKTLQEIAITDEMTGLYNRRGFRMLAHQQHKLALRLEQTMGLLYMDIDDLKEINDLIGHEAGDEAIITAAKCITCCLRENDISARIGGDEFVALVLLSELETLELLIERLSRFFAQQRLSFGRDLHVSIGGILVPEVEMDFDQLMESADQEMYRAKRAKKTA